MKKTLKTTFNKINRMGFKKMPIKKMQKIYFKKINRMIINKTTKKMKNMYLLLC